MKNYVQPAEVLVLTAPYQRNSGEGALVGSIFGVATQDVANGADAPFQIEGVVEIAKTSTQAWTVGQKIYWDNTNKRADSTSTVGPLIGFATEVAANPSATGRVKLVGDVLSSQFAAITSLTGAFGVTGDAIADVTATFSQSILNNNFRALEDKVNALLAALRTSGVVTP